MKKEISKRGRPPFAGETAVGHIHLRVTMSRKSAYVRAARHKPLAQWIFEVCDRAAQLNQENQRAQEEGKGESCDKR